ncbi:MAG: sulfotransferase family protein [Alphaproteobacteria bacterium]|nr:sulfotransferase family protein [Alphaproteobacteria bacterium]
MSRPSPRVHRWERLGKRALRALTAPGRRHARARVLFVAGAQRSGTKMDILARSLQTDVYHESDPAAFADYQMRPLPVIRRLVGGSGAECVVIESLCELQDLKNLLDAFMPAKAIWMVRRYEGMINSHLRLFHGCPPRIAAIAVDRDGAGWRGRGMSDATHALVRTLCHPGLSDASAVALFWYFRNVLFFEQGLDRDPRVRAVRYERLVTAPGTYVERIFDFCDLTYTERVSRHVFASSISKHRPPRRRSADPRRVRGIVATV